MIPVRAQRLNVLNPRIVSGQEYDARTRDAARANRRSTRVRMIERHGLDASFFYVRPWPPSPRVLARSPSRHVESWSDRHHVAVDCRDPDMLMLVVMDPVDAASWRTSLSATGCIVHPDTTVIGSVVCLIEQENAPATQTHNVAKSNIRTTQNQARGAGGG